MKKLFQMSYPPIWVGCDVDAITKLINQGMDLTQRGSLKNGTVMHYWAGGPYKTYKTAEDDSLGVVKLLIEKGADLKAVNTWGFTPLLEAANGRYGHRPNLKVLDFLLEKEDYSRAEKIEAMELAGAVILQNTRNSSIFHIGIDYWRKALHFRRQIELDDLGFIEKPRLNLKSVRTTEWNTSVELEDVIEHPDKFMIQSFLVRLRIFSSKNWGAIQYLMAWVAFMEDFFRHLQYQRRFVDIFHIIWATLETLLSRSDLRENGGAHRKAVEIVKKLIDVFTCLDRDTPDFWTEEIIKTSLDLLVSATKFYDLIVCYLNRFVRMLSHLPRFLLNKDTMETLSSARYQHGRNLLHTAFYYAAIPDADLFGTVRLLLNAGCEPNAIDDYGNAPLHFLAQIGERYLYSDVNSIAGLLLDFGAQLSLKNADGKTAIDLWILKNQRKCRQNEDEEGEIIGWELSDWCTELPTLTCLSARIIRRNRIPYLKLPTTLISLIEKHKLS